jgi:hypothetical protein
MTCDDVPGPARAGASLFLAVQVPAGSAMRGENSAVQRLSDLPRAKRRSFCYGST